jgi:hypothetical protein
MSQDKQETSLQRIIQALQRLEKDSSKKQTALRTAIQSTFGMWLVQRVHSVGSWWDWTMVHYIKINLLRIDYITKLQGAKDESEGHHSTYPRL